YDDTERPKSHRLAAFFGWEYFQQDRLRERLQATAGRALDDAKDDQQRKIRSETTEKRCERETGDRSHQQALTSETVRKPPRHRQNDRVRNQIGSQSPGGFVRSSGETYGEM